MSTILKALRRLEKDGPGESASPAAASEAGASPSIPATEPRATDELRDRILADERANEVTTASAAGGSESSTETDTAADATSASSPTAALRKWAPLAALAIVILMLGVVVVPAVLESGADSEPSAAVATGPTSEQAERGEPIPPRPESPTFVAAATQTPASVPALPRAAPPAPKSASAPSTPVAAVPSTPPAASASAPTRVNAPTKPAGPVAVADLPIAGATPSAPAPAVRPAPPAPGSAVQPRSPAPAPAPQPTRTAPVEPTPPPAELALVEPANGPPPRPESSAAAPSRVDPKPAPPRPALRANPTPPATRKPAPNPIERTPAQPTRVTPEPDRPTSSAGPVAKTADAAPIERIARPDIPDVTVVRTAWHPSSDRRSAKVRLEATDEVLTLREGDAIGALVVKEISPSAVLFETGGVELRRRVGSGG